MDKRFRQLPNLQVDILGYHWLGPSDLTLTSTAFKETEFDVKSILKNKKSIKFMAKQDKMAVTAATNAMNMAGLDTEKVGDKTGLYFSIGSIPFEQQPLDVLYEKSVDDTNAFNMKRFATEAAISLNPLLTFKCLPNMPVYHVSNNLNITGCYSVTYPGAGQWFQILQQAMQDLDCEKIDYAVVCAVADQLNPLVKHHIQRSQPDSIEKLIDTACVFILGRSNSKNKIASITNLKMTYHPRDMLAHTADEKIVKRALKHIDAGPVDPALHLALHLDDTLQKNTELNKYSINISTIDGISASLDLIYK